MKKFIIGLILGLSLTSAFAWAAGIPISSYFNPQFTYPIDSRTVKTDIASRNLIPDGQRFQGLTVYVSDTQENWQLQGGITNSDWVNVASTSSGANCTTYNVPNVSNATTYQTTPTYDGANQAVHPDIYYNASGWNGYKYWLKVDPYPTANDNYEDPSILVSNTNNGSDWVIPTGGSNPIVPRAYPTGFNSDGDLSYNDVDSSLNVTYRYTDYTTDYTDILFTKSTDGINWSTPVTTTISSTDAEIGASPTVVWESGIANLWIVNTKTNSLMYATSTDGVNYSNLTYLRTIPEMWHIKIKKVGSNYLMLETNNKDLFYWWSSDGLVWNPGGMILVPSDSGWDNLTIHRTTFDVQGNSFKIWYGAISSTNRFHIGYTVDSNWNFYNSNCRLGLQSDSWTTIGNYLTPKYEPKGIFITNNLWIGKDRITGAMGGLLLSTSTLPVGIQNYIHNFKNSSGLTIQPSLTGGTGNLLDLKLVNGDTLFTARQAFRIGIGTSTPRTTLDVAGDISISKNSIGKSGTFNMSSDIMPSDVQFYLHDFVNNDGMVIWPTDSGVGNSLWVKDWTGTTTLVIRPSNRVGMGTSTPDSLLEVAGALHISNDNNGVAGTLLISKDQSLPASVQNYINNFAGNVGLLLKPSAISTGDLFQAQKYDGDPIFNIRSSGKVGIGTSTPKTLLEVNGTTTAPCFSNDGLTCITSSVGSDVNWSWDGIETLTPATSTNKVTLNNDFKVVHSTYTITNSPLVYGGNDYDFLVTIGTKIVIVLNDKATVDFKIIGTPTVILSADGTEDWGVGLITGDFGAGADRMTFYFKNSDFTDAADLSNWFSSGLGVTVTVDYFKKSMWTANGTADYTWANPDSLAIVTGLTDPPTFTYSTVNSLFVSSGKSESPIFNAASSFDINGTNVLYGDSNLNNYFLARAGSGSLTGLTGVNNYGLGYGALNSLTDGGNNFALGNIALSANTTGDWNTAIGSTALQNNTDGNQNTAIGKQAMQNNFTGNDNIAIGDSALIGDINVGNSGDYNIAIGGNALQQSVSAFNNIAIGQSAMQNSISSDHNIAIGENSLNQVTNGSNNIALGLSTMQYNTSGGNNNAFGAYALQNNTTGSNNIAIGGNAMQTNTTGGQNLAIGNGALQHNTTAQNNVAVGTGAMEDNTTGFNNLAFGISALGNNITGAFNTAVGTGALGANIDTENNLAFGNGALGNLTTGAGNNTTIGANAMQFSTSSEWVLAIGGSALQILTTGKYITAVGSLTGRSLTTADYGTYLGYEAGKSETEGNRLYIDGLDRDNITRGRTESLMYGKLDLTVANQFLTVNGKLGVNVTPTSDFEVYSPTFGSGITIQAQSLMNGIVPDNATPVALMGKIVSQGVSAGSHIVPVIGIGEDNKLNAGAVIGVEGRTDGHSGVAGMVYDGLQGRARWNDASSTDSTTFAGNVIGMDSITEIMDYDNVTPRYEGNAAGLYVHNPVGSANAYGILIDSVTGHPGEEYGLRIGESGTSTKDWSGTLWLSYNTNATTSSGGIKFGQARDVNVYRSSIGTSPVLKTDNFMDAKGFYSITNGTPIFALASDETLATASSITLSTTTGQTLFLGMPAGFAIMGGNVGIGTTTPDSLLDVNGTVTVNDVCIRYGGVCLSTVSGGGGAGSPGTWQWNGWALTPTSTSAGIFVNASSTFNSTLQVNGNINVVAESYYKYNGQNMIYASTTLHNYFFVNSGNSTTTGAYNTVIGELALFSNITGEVNTAIGYNALKDNTYGDRNTALGYSALFSNTTGDYNLAIGGQSLFSNISGSNNVAIGHGSLNANISGGHNLSIGISSLLNNTTGSYNIGNGNSSLRGNILGNYNTAIGYYALGSVLGSNNIGIGTYAGRYETGTSTFYLNNQDRSSIDGDQTLSLLYGGFATLAANQFLTVNGHLNVTGTTTLTLATTTGNTTIDNTIYFKDGKVGIGTQTIRSPLTINTGAGATGAINMSYNGLVDNEGADWYYNNSGDTSVYFDSRYNSNTAAMYFRMKTSSAATTTAMTILGSGNVGIGDTSPAKLFTVGNGDKFTVDTLGNVTSTLNLSAQLETGGATANVTYTTVSGNIARIQKISSLKKYKTDINYIGVDADWVLDLKPISYTWKSTGQPLLGLLAEEVIKIDSRFGMYDNGTLQGVDWNAVTTGLISTVQKQQEQINELIKEINQIKKSNISINYCSKY